MKLWLMAFVLFFSAPANAAVEGFLGFNLGWQRVPLGALGDRFTFGLDGGARLSPAWGYAINFQNSSKTIDQGVESELSSLGIAGHWFPFSEQTNIWQDLYIGPSVGLEFEIFEINALKASEMEPYVGAQVGWTTHLNEHFATGLELRSNWILGDPEEYSVNSLLAVLRIIF